MKTKNLMHIDSYNIGNINLPSEYQRLYINNLIGEKLKSGSSKAQVTDYIHCNINKNQELAEYIENKFNYYITNESNGIIVEDEYIIDLRFSSSNSLFTTYWVSILAGSKAECKKHLNNLKLVLKDFIEESRKISYEIIQYRDCDSLDSSHYQDNVYKNFNPLSFPYIDDIDKYIESFLKSNASLLILKGIPGTGKTTFSKEIITKIDERKIDRSSLNVLYSFDENIFYSNEFFRKIQFGNFDVVVLEDFNSLIQKNQESENVNPLNKFLSSIEGLISKNTKIIISTNIESKNQLNSALIRPGRCFDVLNFRKLEKEEIDNLCDSCDKDLDLQIESINLSEFYAKLNSEQNTTCSDNSLGFKK